jgi:uncharacterized membrane protein YfcA
MLAALPIILITFFSQTLEYVLGFGGTLVALVIGTYFYPVNDMLYLLIPINLILNISVIFRDRDFIDYKLLILQIIPWMIVGFALSHFIAKDVEQGLQIAIIGGTLVVSAIRAILTQLILKTEKQPQHQKFYRSFIKKHIPTLYYMIGGFAQAAMGAGGPFVIFQVANKAKHHRALRGTLGCLWLVMNIALIVSLLKNHIPGSIVGIQTFISMVVVFPFAVLVGEKISKQIPSKVIPYLINSVLLLSGLSLLWNYFK